MLERITHEEPLNVRISTCDSPAYTGCDVAIGAEYNCVNMRLDTGAPVGYRRHSGEAVAAIEISDETHEIFLRLYSLEADSDDYNSEFLFKLVDRKWEAVDVTTEG